MAVVTKIQYGDAGDEVSFQDGDAGIQLLPGWLARIAPLSLDAPNQIEELPIRITGSNHDDLAFHLKELQELQRDSVEYDDGVKTTGVWLHAKLNNETGERRVFTKSIMGDFATSWFGSSGSIETSGAVSNIAEIPLMIERRPFWESITGTSTPSASQGDAAAFLYDYTLSPGADVVGDIGARVNQLEISNTTAAVTIDRLWVGIRSTKFGDPAALVPVWECEDGTNEALASDVVQALASKGIEVEGTPSGDDTWEKYLTIKTSDAVGSTAYTDNWGTFLWLLRWKVPSSSTFDVELRFGFDGMADSDWMRGGKVRLVGDGNYAVSSGRWIATVPFALNRFSGYPGLSNVSKTWAIQIWARRTSGSGKVYFDCLMPIPLDEGWLIAEGMDLANTERFVFGELPCGDTMEISKEDKGPPTARPEIDTHNFRYPPGDGRLVMAYARASTSVLTDAIDIETGSYYPAWASLRGDE